MPLSKAEAATRMLRTDYIAVYVSMLHATQRREGALFEDRVDCRRVSKYSVVRDGLYGLCGGHDDVNARQNEWMW